MPENRDVIDAARIARSIFCSSMIFGSRFPLFRIML
jgi:hypothetical protein